MFFDKNIEPCCSYCVNGNKISDDEVICVKKGIVTTGDCCGKFVYDPLKRKPSRPAILDTRNITEDDFAL